jgi:hypothetical protein
LGKGQGRSVANVKQSHAVKSGGESGRRLSAVINDHRPWQQTLTVWQSNAARTKDLQEEQQNQQLILFPALNVRKPDLAPQSRPLAEPCLRYLRTRLPTLALRRASISVMWRSFVATDYPLLRASSAKPNIALPCVAPFPPSELPTFSGTTGPS